MNIKEHKDMGGPKYNERNSINVSNYWKNLGVLCAIYEEYENTLITITTKDKIDNNLINGN